MLTKSVNQRPRGGLGFQVQYIGYAVEALCHDIGEIAVPKRKLPSSLWSIISKEHKIKSLRTLAQEYRVSYETLTRVLNTPLV